MRTLVIDCATEACSVALLDDAVVLDDACHRLGRGHAEALVPMIAALPGGGRADRIAVSLGPGSFTGVRVGLAAARALAFAWNARLVGYPTLALIAAMARHDAGAVPVTVAVTGGHGEWFVERFAGDGRSLAPLASLPPAEAAALGGGGLVAGSQAEAVVALAGSGQALPIWPDARAFAALPGFAIGDDIAPLYGRAPDAQLPAAVR